MRKRKIAQHYKHRKKIEFSKKWLIGCIIISIVYTTFSYVLAWFDKNAVETLTVEIIETLWGTSSISFAGYVLQNCVRSFTASKYGIPMEDIKEEESDNYERTIQRGRHFKS